MPLRDTVGLIVVYRKIEHCWAGPGERRRRMTRHRLRYVLAGLAIALALAGCGAGSGGSSSGSGPLQIWEGWTGVEATTFAHLISEYQQQNPGQKISSLFVNND